MNWIEVLRAIARTILGSTPPSREEVDRWMRNQVGEIPRFEMTWGDVMLDLQALGLRCMSPDAPDYKIYYTDEEHLAKISPFLTYPADYYVAELEIDCDDYAKWAAADASSSPA